MEQEYVLKLLLSGYTEFSLNEADRSGTQRYFERNTTYAWLREETLPDRTASIPAAELYETYRKWCANSGEKAVSQTAFGRILSDQGYGRERTSSGIFRTGLALKG